jgi:hypothetical protein
MSCADLRNALLRVMYDEDAAVPAELQSHLTDCPACRAAVSAAREFAATMRTALEPEPLSAHALEQVRRRIEPGRTRRRVPRLISIGVTVGALAAGLVAALVLPTRPRPSAMTASQANGHGAMALSADDAAMILRTYGDLGWDGSVETSLDLLREKVNDVSRDLGLESQGHSKTALPWDRENDWDLPAGDNGTAGSMTNRELCDAAGKRPGPRTA